MRIRILLVGDNPESVAADGLLLRERSLMVITTFNTQNLDEMVDEVKPDIVFFDPHGSNMPITDAYNSFLVDSRYAHIPIIFTLSEDNIYLVTRKRTAPALPGTNIVNNNIIEAVKALLSNDNDTFRSTCYIARAVPALISGTKE